MGTLEFLEINTKGSCALCLKDCCGSAEDDASGPNGCRPQGFKLMMRYLKVDVVKLALSYLSPSLQRSMEDLGGPAAEVEVTSLCTDCRGLAGKFWELYEAYEDALLKMTDCVQSLHSLVREGVNCEGRKEEYEKRMRCKTFMELLGGTVAEGLRTEIMKQCLLNLEAASQRVSLLNGLRDREDVVPAQVPPPEEMYAPLTPSATPASPGLSEPTPTPTPTPPPPTTTPPPDTTNEKRSRKREGRASETSMDIPPRPPPPQPLLPDRNSVCSKEADADVGTNSTPPPPSVASSSNKSVTLPSSSSNGTTSSARPSSSEPVQSSQQKSQSATSNRSTSSSLNGTEEPGTSSSMKTEVETHASVAEEELAPPQVTNDEISVPVPVVVKEEEMETEDVEIILEVISTPWKNGRKRNRRCNDPPEPEVIGSTTRSTRSKSEGSSRPSDERNGQRQKRRRSEVVKPTTTTPESARATRTRRLLDFKCAHCDRKFRDAYDRRMHMLSKHPIQVLSNQLPQGTTEKRLEAAVRGVMGEVTVVMDESASHPYGCPCCRKEFGVWSRMKLHILDCHFKKVQAKLRELRKKKPGGGGGAGAAPAAAPEFISFKRGYIKDTSSSESDSD